MIAFDYLGVSPGGMVDDFPPGVVNGCIYAGGQIRRAGGK